MFDEPVRRIMRSTTPVRARPGTLVARAAGLMAARNVGAILVVGARLAEHADCGGHDP